MLTWIEHGFLLNFVSVHSACQVVHPRYKEKVESVTQLLQTTVSKEQVPALLIGNKPTHVHFANRVSCHMYKDFARENQYTSMWVSDYNERKFTREHGRDLSCCIFLL